MQNVLTCIRKNAIILQTNKQTKVYYTLRKGVQLFSSNCISKKKGGNGLIIHCFFSVRGALC